MLGRPRLDARPAESVMTDTPTPSPAVPSARRHGLRAGAAVVWVGLVTLAVVHGYYVTRYAVDLPYWDEWEALRPGALSPSFNPAWIVSPHNEHRIVPTRMLTWTLYKLDGWNIAHQIAINYVIYLALVALVMAVGCRLARVPPTIAAAFALFLLSTTAWQNHSWGFQSQFHFFLLFGLGAVLCWFGAAATWRSRAGGAACAVLAAYSLSAGVPMAMVIATSYAAWSLWRWRVLRQSNGASTAWDLCAAAVVGVFIVLWLVGYAQHPTSATRLTMPWHHGFWQFLTNGISSGIGLRTSSILPGGVILLAWAAASVVVLRRSLRRAGATLPPRAAGLVVAGLAILAALAPIAMARSTLLDPHAAARTSRYLEISGVFPPLLAFALYAVTRGRDRWVALGALWLLCAVGLHDDYTFSRYREIGAAGGAGRRCIASQLDQPRIDCPGIYPGPIDDMVHRAFELNVSFTRTMGRPAVAE